MKIIKSDVLADACKASIRTQQKLVACVQADVDKQGVRYAVFLSREELTQIQPHLGNFLSFEIDEVDLGSA